MNQNVAWTNILADFFVHLLLWKMEKSIRLKNESDWLFFEVPLKILCNIHVLLFSKTIRKPWTSVILHKLLALLLIDWYSDCDYNFFFLFSLCLMFDVDPNEWKKKPHPIVYVCVRCYFYLFPSLGHCCLCAQNSVSIFFVLACLHMVGMVFDFGQVHILHLFVRSVDSFQQTISCALIHIRPFVECIRRCAFCARVLCLG